MSSLVLEKVLRYAYFNGYTCIQWADPVKQCLQQSEQDSSQDLCDILLTHVFSTARVHNILLESYLTYALTGESQLTKQGAVIDDSKTLINGKLFLSRLLARDVRFATTHEYNYQWACILNILPSLLVDVDGDRKEHLTWAPILSRLLVTLSHIVAVGLYPERKSSTTNPQHLQYDDLDGSDQERDPDDTENQQIPFEDLSASQQLDMSLTNNTTQMAMDSQMTFDPDATLDFDATQPDSFDGQDTNEDGGDGDLVLGTSTTATSTDGGFQSHQKNILASTAAQQHTSQTSSLYTNTCSGSSSTKVNLDWDNAISAARIIIDLIEKKGAKRIIDKYEQGQKERELNDTSNAALETIDPWVTCHEILVPGDQKPSSASTSNTHNVYIQKLLLLVERLTDRDLERRLAVHMKYHELEDEGTARAMPSAGLMGLVYHMVQIRPALDDEDLVNRLVKLQAIKGSFDESFYLELWFTALTGLREASFSTSCQSNVTPKNTMDTEDSNDFNICNTTVATNRLLWKNLVLVKLPHLISQLQERKAKEELANYSLKRDQKSSSQKNESNAIESSLMELKTFTGLLNACSPPACCSEFYVPSSKSSKLVNQFAFGNGNGDPQQISSAMEDNDDDSMMHIIDDMGFTSSTDFNTPTFIKAIRSVSSDDIFTSIIHSCRPYNFLRDDKIDTLLNSTEHNVAKETAITSNPIKSEYDDNNDDMDIFINNELKHEDDYPSSSLFDDDLNITKLNDCAQQGEKDEKPDTLIQIEQNIDERMDAIRSNVTQSSISELIHIGLVSLIYWRKIVDFILNLLQEKAQIGDVQTLSRICDALDECPSAIDLILQLYHPSVLLSPLESICNDWNPSEDYIDMDDGASGSNENEDDDDMGGIQNWYFKFGKIWMFVLVVANKFDIARNINDIFKIEDGLCYQFFITGDIIYGVHAHDEQVEELVGRWLSAMGGDGISDDLLRTTKLQMLLRATPTIIDRLLCIYDSGQIDIETFTGVLSYFRRRFLRFVLVPRVTDILCGELLNQNASTALTCMSHLLLNQPLPDTLIALCGNTILGSLRTWMECQRQNRKLVGNKIKTNISDMQQQQQHQIPNEDDNQAKALEQFFMNKLDLDDEQHVSFPETVSNGVTRRTLLEKAREMFRYIVKSGRSMYMNDVDGDAKTLWEPVANSKPPKQVVSHYLDLVMFQAALKMGGIHWFISMIVDEVLEAGKSGGAVRAAELGSCLLTTPLTYHAHGSSVCLSMLRCLLQDVIPSSINYCFNKNTSFFQGQTLGVFTSDCLVLMHNSTVDLVDEIGDKFFKALVIDRVRGGDVSSLQMVTQSSEDGTRFAPWNEEVVGSPVWRGFVKGLMSNPFIKEMWPGAYGS